MRAPLAPMLVPGFCLLGLTVILVLSHGGYASSSWYPGALFVLALTVVLLIAVPMPASARWRENRWILWALALFAVWCFCSVLWSSSPGMAWDGANRTLMYVLALAAVTLLPWTHKAARILLAGVVASLTVIAAGVLVATVTRANPGTLFLTGRLSDPTGYSNATANLWLMACLPAIWFAADRSVRWPLRGLALAAAGLLAATTLLSQSRGSIVAFAVGAVVLVVLAPRRWPAVLALLAVLAAVAVAARPILHVRDHLDPPTAVAAHGVGGALHDARLAIVAVTVALLLVGLVGALLDERISRGLAPIARLGDRVIAIVVLLLVVGGAAATGNPAHWLDQRWKDFKTAGYTQVEASGSRFNGGLGSNRYDFYRVGLDELADHPVLGVGADSFGPGYLRRGHSVESPRYAHSLLIGTLAETGIVGGLLLGAFFVLALLALVRRRGRNMSPAVAGPLGAAAAGAAAFFGGAQVDWLWQFPALGLLGFLLLGIALACREPVPGPDPRRRARHAWLWRSGGALAALGVALSFALPGISARFTDSAYSTAASNPTLSLHRLAQAADFDPLSAGPELARSIILRRVGDLAAQRGALDEAVSREPENWFAYLERAMLESQTGNWPSARRDVSEAARLNPRQVIVPLVRRAIARRRPVRADVVEARLAAQLASKIGQGA
ncbi:MAG: hypothetical protein JWM71_2086 [Solirubrobacteraceae bacterium]|nr:hypothetical protein [Solirubrobacteraceae bacterium]